MIVRHVFVIAAATATTATATMVTMVPMVPMVPMVMFSVSPAKCFHRFCQRQHVVQPICHDKYGKQCYKKQTIEHDP